MISLYPLPANAWAYKVININRHLWFIYHRKYFDRLEMDEKEKFGASKYRFRLNNRFSICTGSFDVKIGRLENTSVGTAVVKVLDMNRILFRI